MVNYDLLKEHIQQIYENYPYLMPTLFIILATVLGTIISVMGLTV